MCEQFLRTISTTWSWQCILCRSSTTYVWMYLQASIIMHDGENKQLYMQWYNESESYVFVFFFRWCMTSHLVNLKAKTDSVRIAADLTILEIKTAAISMSESDASSVIFIVARAYTEQLDWYFMKKHLNWLARKLNNSTVWIMCSVMQLRWHFKKHAWLK